MPHSELFVGIDVAKSELVIHLHPTGEGWRCPNDARGIATLGRRLRKLAGQHIVRIGFEASGGYERKLAICLDRLQLAAYLLDPARVRSFARAERQIAKTDPLDAAVIARALAALHAELTPYRHNPVARRLAEHVRLRDLAIAQTRQLANQMETLDEPAVRRLVQAQIVRLKALVLRIEQAIARLIAEAPDLARREAILRSAPGVGPIVAACLIAHMPELGQISGKQAASLAGLAPFDRQSGKSAKPGRCAGGRPAVRRLLYLAALSIMRTAKSHLAATGHRLQAAGKPRKLALIAVARKLLVTLNAMLSTNQTFLAA
jgi:transposase